MKFIRLLIFVCVSSVVKHGFVQIPNFNEISIQKRAGIHTRNQMNVTEVRRINACQDLKDRNLAKDWVRFIVFQTSKENSYFYM